MAFHAPNAAFPTIPTGWYYLCRSKELNDAPLGCELGDLEYVAFRNGAGRPAVLDARCAHMGANLASGCVKDGIIHCPLHGWQYDGDGRCVRIPACAQVPVFARQAAYPTAEFGGHLAFYNAPTADYAMPFFDGCSPAVLRPAEPFDFIVKTPWYLIGANAFDTQHFRVAHDRTLVSEPAVDAPSPLARRISALYDVTGNSLRDRLTRRFSGPQVKMTATVWAGTLILVSASFRRTTSYGMVFVRPLAENRTHVRVIAWVPRRRNSVMRLIDPIDAWIRRRFIRAFLMEDALRSDGLRYNPATLIDADSVLSDYLSWLMSSSNPAAQVTGAKESP